MKILAVMVRTIDIEVEVMRRFNVRRNVIVPNVSWGITDDHGIPLHECDVLILNERGYATEVEIKTSMSDLKKDMEKRHGHSHSLIKFLYFAIPRDMYERGAEDYIPEKAGIIVVWEDMYGTIFSKEVRKARQRKFFKKWDDNLRMQLYRLGMMRLYGLKVALRSYL